MKKEGKKFERSKIEEADKKSAKPGMDEEDITQEYDNGGTREFSPPSTKPEVDTGRYSQHHEESPDQQDDLGNPHQRLQMNPKMADTNTNQPNPN